MSAWANVQAPKAARLNDIMVDQEYLTSDLSLAELISFEEIQGGTAEPLPAECYDEIALVVDDADFALALALQEQLFEEERAQKPISENHGNIRVASGDHNVVLNLDPQSVMRGKEYDQYNTGSDVVIEKALRSHAQKKRVKGVEVSGRISAKDFKTTKQGVLDPATNLLLFKMLQNGTLARCDTNVTVKTGKEATVFYGEPDFDGDKNDDVDQTKFENGCAVKIFKTTLNEFSNRADYYDGDHRFGKFNKVGTTRDAIAKWAEKEYRNLMRVNKRSKVFAPQALTFKEHIVIMSFVGNAGIPAPQLREVPEANLSPFQWTSVYLDTIAIVHSLYHDCKLVHGDLSEYNLLLHGGETWVIDFGQAVDTSHPNHIAFMLRDVRTVNKFFKKQGVCVLEPESTLSLVLQPSNVLDANLSAYRSECGDASTSVSSNDSVVYFPEDVIREMIVKRLILQSIDV